MKQSGGSVKCAGIIYAIVSTLLYAASIIISLLLLLWWRSVKISRWAPVNLVSVAIFFVATGLWWAGIHTGRRVYENKKVCPIAYYPCLVCFVSIVLGGISIWSSNTCSVGHFVEVQSYVLAGLFLQQCGTVTVLLISRRKSLQSTAVSRSLVASSFLSLLSLASGAMGVLILLSSMT